jgi:hypothetical protein
MSPAHQRNDDLKNRLERASEINLTVTGRKSGRTITNPVWFVLDNDQLDLLPVSGSATQWYKNVLKNPAIVVEAGGRKAELRGVPTTDPKEVASVAAIH